MIIFQLILIMILQTFSIVCNVNYEDLIRAQRDAVASKYVKRTENSLINTETCNEIEIKKIVSAIPTKTIMGHHLVHSALTTFAPNSQPFEDIYGKQHYFEDNARKKMYKHLFSRIKSAELAFLNLWTEEEQKNKLFAQKYSIPFFLGAEHASIRNTIFLAKGATKLYPKIGIAESVEQRDYITAGLLTAGLLLPPTLGYLLNVNEHKMAFTLTLGWDHLFNRSGTFFI